MDKSKLPKRHEKEKSLWERMFGGSAPAPKKPRKPVQGSDSYTKRGRKNYQDLLKEANKTY